MMQYSSFISGFVKISIFSSTCKYCEKIGTCTKIEMLHRSHEIFQLVKHQSLQKQILKYPQKQNEHKNQLLENLPNLKTFSS